MNTLRKYHDETQITEVSLEDTTPEAHYEAIDPSVDDPYASLKPEPGCVITGSTRFNTNDHDEARYLRRMHIDGLTVKENKMYIMMKSYGTGHSEIMKFLRPEEA